MNEQQLVKAIKAHIEKGDQAKGKSEQHYIAAGQHLKMLKEGHGGTWAEWEELLKDKCGIGKSRASELMMLADGRKTPAEISADTTRRSIKHREGSPLRNGESRALTVIENDDSEEDAESFVEPNARDIESEQLKAILLKLAEDLYHERNCEARLHKLRWNAGAGLLALKGLVEKTGASWWEWYGQRNLRPRREAERFMALAKENAE